MRMPTTILASAILALVCAGCAGGGVTEEDHAACLAAGHAPESAGYESCIQERLALRFARPEGGAVDDLRTRVGPSF